MPRPGHVSKRKPPVTSIPRPTSIQQASLSHCSLSLLIFCGLCPQSTLSRCPCSQVQPLLNQVVRPGKLGCLDRGVPTAVTFDSECSSPSFTSTSHPPTQHNLNHPPGMGDPCMEAQLRRQLPNHPDALACRLESPSVDSPAGTVAHTSPRHPWGKGGIAAGRPKRDRA